MKSDIKVMIFSQESCLTDTSSTSVIVWCISENQVGFQGDYKSVNDDDDECIIADGLSNPSGLILFWSLLHFILCMSSYTRRPNPSDFSASLVRNLRVIEWEAIA